MEHYTIQKIKETLYIIHENYAEDSALEIGLLPGQDTALLIDSGMGVFGSELRNIVKQITDKPIKVLCTHGHPDHIAGSVLFDDVYMNERDESQLARLAPERRLGDIGMFSHDNAEVMKYAKENCIDCSGFRYKNIDDGDTVDAGGLKVEVIKLPGHSMGSLAYYNREDNYAFVGDAFGKQIPASSMTSLSQFRVMGDCIKNFRDAIRDDTMLYAGHKNMNPISDDIILDLMHCCYEIAEGKVEKDEDIYMPISPVPNQKKHIYGAAAITYNPKIVK